MKPRSKSLWIDAGGLRRLGAARDGPGARLLRPDGEEGDQPEQLVAGADHALQAAVVQARVLRGTRRDRPPAVAPPRPRSPPKRRPTPRTFRARALLDPRGERVAGGRRGLLDVADVEHRLRGQQLQPLAPPPPGPARSTDARRPARAAARRPAAPSAPAAAIASLSPPRRASAPRPAASPGCRDRRASARSRPSRHRAPDRCCPRHG